MVDDLLEPWDGVLHVVQGSLYDAVFAWYDESDPPAPQPIPVHWRARMQVRRKAGDTGDPLVDLTSENGGLTIDHPAGTVTVVIGADVTVTLTRNAAFDLELYDPDDPAVVHNLAPGGKVDLTKQVTLP